MGKTSSDKKGLWEKLWQPSQCRYALGLPIGGALAIVVGALLLSGFKSAIHITNSNEFCYGCHVGMDTVVEEYETSVHFQNTSGVGPDCADCHVPKELLPKLKVKAIALINLYHTLAGTYKLEDFEQHRLPLAQVVWDDMQATGSRECRNCHDPERWDLAAQPARARTNHDPSLWERNEETCIDCHYGIAHKRPTIE